MGTLIATTHAARFQPSFSVLNDAGVNVERALSRGKFPSKLLHDPDMIVAPRSLSMFAARLARQNGIEDLAFSAARKQDFSQLENWVKTCLLGTATLGEMLQRYCEIANRYNTYHQYDLRSDTRLARVCCTMAADTKIESWHRFSDWSNVAYIRVLIRHVLGATFEPTAFTFHTTGPISPEIENDLGGTRLLQGWKTASVVFPKHLLAKPVPNSCPSECKLDRCTQDGLKEEPFPAVMKQLLKPCLPHTWLDVETAAEMSGSRSVRTFQRRLSESGLTFRTLLEQTRMEVARALLKGDDCKVIDVAFEVGYEDPTHFSRAFRRSHGLSPTEFRNTARHS